MRELKYERPWLYEKQQAAIFSPKRFALIEASTKAGKTVGCMTWLLEQAINPEVPQAGRNYWWIAPVYKQASIAFGRMRRGLPAGVAECSEGKLSIALPNGATITFCSAEKPDNLFGEDVYAAVIDEATRCREEAWHAIRSTLTATRGPIRIIGNVKGRKNWAYHLARKAEAGEPDMSYAKLTAFDAAEAGILKRDEVEDAQRQLPEAVFRELYLAEPSDDGGNPFGISAIRACVEPQSAAPPSVWGWDLAKSIDWTVGVALDSSGKTCRFERWNMHLLPPGFRGEYWAGTQDRIRACIADRPTLVDSTGVGDPVFQQIASRKPKVEPFIFSPKSKQQIMEGLALAIQQRAIAYPPGPIVTELEGFEYEYTRTGVRYSAPEGMHDDCVCALALAVAQRARPRPRGSTARVTGL